MTEQHEPHAPLFEVFPDRAGSYRFRLVAGNGEIIATSEAYTRPADARRAVETLKRLAPAAELRLVATRDPRS